MRFKLFLLLALAPVPALAQSSRGPAPRGNPSELVAAESALAHLARDDLARGRGANAAMQFYADDTARTWVKTHDAAPWFVDRQTSEVWASCDGTAGVSTGLWRGGWFATVWKQQKKFNYKWVLADAGPLTVMPPAPDWVTGKLADCPARVPHPEGTLRPLPAAIPAPGPADHDGRSDDGSLVWRSTDGTHHLTVWAWQNGAMKPVIER